MLVALFHTARYTIRRAAPLLVPMLVSAGIAYMNGFVLEAEKRQQTAEEGTQALAAHAEELRRVIASRQLVLDELDSGIDPEDQRL